MSQDFLMQCKEYEHGKHPVSGKLLSEKLDGMRAVWDGGVSRGYRTIDVPYSNTAKDTKIRYSTGLWSRYGKPLIAPDWFVNTLPVGVVLDGEIWAGRGNFQKVMSAARKHSPVDSEWRDMQYVVFDIADPQAVFSDREINTQHFKKHLRGCLQWWLDSMKRRGHLVEGPYDKALRTRYQWLGRQDWWSDFVIKHEQSLLPLGHDPAVAEVERRLSDILELGGEGLVIRTASSLYECSRTLASLKYKPFKDAEGYVVGFLWGKDTDKGGRLVGMVGSLLVRWEGKNFKVSGLTDDDRRVSTSKDFSKLISLSGMSINTDEDVPLGFKIGDTITFKYRELTEDGIPKEARYKAGSKNRQHAES